MSILAIAGKEVRDILRERSIIVAVLVQFFIAAFSTFLTVGLLALYDPGSASARPQADVGYTGPGGFADELASLRNLDLHRGMGLSDFHNGTIDAAIEETIRPDGAHTITIVIPEGELQSTLLVTQLRDVLQAYETKLRLANQTALTHSLVELPDDQSRAPVPYGFVYSTLVPLLLLTPVFLAGAVAGDAFTQEIERKTLLILRSAPISTRRVLLGKLIVPTLLAPLQFLLWAALLLANRQPVHNLPLLLVLSMAITLLLAGTGYAIAARLKREGPVQASYALIALGLAVGSLLLPRDPLNLIARLASGNLDSTAIVTVICIVAAAVAAAWWGTADAARRIRKDLV